MAAIFCCSGIRPFKPTSTDHEAKFNSFLSWAQPMTSTPAADNEAAIPLGDSSSYVIQVVRQVNYGPIEFKRYFVVLTGGDFLELSEKALIDANFEKLNSYKNFRCAEDNKFFELNIYKKDPVNKHHWRANIARPATEIDLPGITSGSGGNS